MTTPDTPGTERYRRGPFNHANQDDAGSPPRGGRRNAGTCYEQTLRSPTAALHCADDDRGRRLLDDFTLVHRIIDPKDVTSFNLQVVTHW